MSEISNNISILYSEVLYSFSIMFFDELGKVDEQVASLSKLIAPDEVLERSAIPPISTVFVLNECIHYEKFNSFTEIPELDVINKLAESAYEKYYNYITLFAASKRSTLPSEGKMIS